jgi:hypothetical protein
MKAYLKPDAATVATIEAALRDWGLEHDNDEMWECWKMFDRTGGAVLPEAGGWLDQSLEIRAFFNQMYLLKAFHQLPAAPKPPLGNDW